jgi:hypothetical protein
MKKVIASTFVLLNIAFVQVLAQEDVQKSLKIGFKSGNVKEIAPYLSTKTELAFDGDKKVYQKEKAEQVLQNFLTQNKPKDFQVLHQGASKEGLKFYIGEFVSINGTYRVLVYMKKSLIETIDISKE